MNSHARASGFQRRIYASPVQFVRDLWRIARSIRAVLALSSRAGIAAGFRERIMLVVTGVNRCRHCAWGHEILAHQVGLSKVEIASLLVLDLANCPDSEIPGLLYAIHWTESDTGRPQRRAEPGWKRPTDPGPHTRSKRRRS
jgi:AhpD family alkylhydroperoxidase